MKDLRPIRGRHLLTRLIEEGEHERQDFKYAVNDARKIARSISAFANHLGGRLLIGVKDNGTPAGVRNEEDIYVVEQAALMYCRPAQQVEFTSYRMDDGAIVIRAEIAQAAVPPVKVVEADGTLRAYFRVADENIAAHPLMVRAWEQSAAGGSACIGAELHRRILMKIEEGYATIPALMTALHISRRSAEDAVTTLAQLHMVRFRHTPGGFILEAT